MGQTLQALSNGRFLLGIGRSAAWRWRDYGVPAPTLASLGDAAEILRRLWAGETVRLRRPGRAIPPAPAAPATRCGPAAGPAGGGRPEDPGPGRAVRSTASSCTPSSPPTRSAVRSAVIRDGRRRRRARPGRAADLCDRGRRPGPQPERHRAGRPRPGRRVLPRRGPGRRAGRGQPSGTPTTWPATAATPPSSPSVSSRPTRPSPGPSSSSAGPHPARPSGWPRRRRWARPPSAPRRLHEYLDAGADELILHGTTAEHLGALAASFGGDPLTDGVEELGRAAGRLVGRAARTPQRWR